MSINDISSTSERKRSKYRKTEEREKREVSGRISFLAEDKKGGEKKKTALSVSS
jgi:hypothetical protein